jgi:hypothetical protein
MASNAATSGLARPACEQVALLLVILVKAVGFVAGSSVRPGAIAEAESASTFSPRHLP